MSAIKKKETTINAIKKLFECKICSGSLKKSTVSVNCGHLFCLSCYKKIQKSQIVSCPVCQESFEVDKPIRREDVCELAKAFNRLTAAFEKDKLFIKPTLSKSQITNSSGLAHPISSTKGKVAEPSDEMPGTSQLQVKPPGVVLKKSLSQVEIVKKSVSQSLVNSDDICNDAYDNILLDSSNNQDDSTAPLDLTIKFSNSQLTALRNTIRPKVVFQCVSPILALDLSSKKRKLDETNTDPVRNINPPFRRLKTLVRKSLESEFVGNQQAHFHPGNQYPPGPYTSRSLQIENVKDQGAVDFRMMSPPSKPKMIKFSRSVEPKAVGYNGRNEDNIGAIVENSKNPLPNQPPLYNDFDDDDLSDHPSDQMLADLDLESVTRLVPNPVNRERNGGATTNDEALWKSPSSTATKKTRIQNKNNNVLNSPTSSPNVINNDENDVESDSSNDSFLCSTPKREARSFSKGVTTKSRTSENILSPVKKVLNGKATTIETPTIISGPSIGFNYVRKGSATTIETPKTNPDTSNASLYSASKTRTLAKIMNPGTGCCSPPPEILQGNHIALNETPKSTLAAPKENVGDDDDIFSDDDNEAFDFDENEVINNAGGPGINKQPVNVPTTSNRVENKVLTQTKQSEELFSTPPESSTPERTFVFCSSRLNRAQTEKLHRLCQICGGTVVEDYTDDVTHMVLMIERNIVPQTMKYLFAIGGKKWVVVFDWVEECLKQNKMVPEVTFEASSLNFGSCQDGPRNARLANHLLFEGYSFHVFGNLKKSSGASVEGWENLLEKLGGKVILDSNRIQRDTLIVGDSLSRSEMYQEWFRTHGALTVTWEWILDCCIESYTVNLLTKRDIITKLDGTERLPHAVKP